MKNILLLVTLLLMPLSLFAQCDKLPGEAGSFTWSYPVTDEPKITGFRLYSSPVQSGPFNNLVGSATQTARALTAPVTFAVGTVRTFYVVRPYFTSGGGTVEAPDSNSVECELRVPSATNLQAR